MNNDTQKSQDNRSRQLNPENSTYWKDRGQSRPNPVPAPSKKK